MSKLPKGFGNVPATRVPFGDRLSGLCAMYLAAGHGNPEVSGEMIERLLNSLAFTISMACKGDAKAMDEMLEGAVSYLYESATKHGPVAEALTKAGI